MDIKIPDDKTGSIAQRGTDYIRRLIETGQLAPGQQLPSLREFSSSNDTSIATAQRIYASLEEDGLVTAEHGSGTKVAANIHDAMSNQGAVTVFWSYAHKDDENSRGAISELLKAIKAEYELQTGTELVVFKNNDSISWGANWRDCINDALLNTVFFIPVLSPTYLKRPACLNELRTAYFFYKEHGIEQGIYPIRFVDIKKALQHFGDDELAILIGDTQGINFYEAGTRDPASKGYIDAVSTIVAKLIEIDDELVSQNDRSALPSSHVEDEEDGILDSLAMMEEAVSNQEILLGLLSNDMELITDLTKRKTREIKVSDQNNEGFAGRLLISKSMASEMRPLAENLLTHSKNFSESVQHIDKGVRAYAAVCKEQGGKGRSEKFENGIATLVGESERTIEQCRAYITTLNGTRRISRDLREPIEIVARGLELFCSNGSHFQEWAREIDSLNSSTRIPSRSPGM